MPNPVWGLSDPSPAMKLDCNDCNADQNSTRLPKFLKSLPLIVVILALAWGYESFVISMTISFTLRKRRDVGLGIAQLVVFHVLWGGTVWSLLVTVMRGPGRVRRWETNEGGRGRRRRGGGLEDGEGDGFEGSGTDSVGVPLLARDSLEESRSNSESQAQSGRPSSVTNGDRVEGVHLGVQAKSDGKPRYCRKCDVPKPDRSHHCSTCGYCVLEMDHHCPWVGGCVGHRNRKSFILFLVYLTLLAVACCPFAAVNLMRFVKTPMPDVSEFELAPISWSFLMLLGGMLSLIVGSFTAWHLYLVGTNRTTIESMERKARSRVRLPGERLEDPVLPSQERSTQSHSDRQAEERPSSTYPPMSSKPPYIQGFQEYSGPSSATRSGWRDGVGAAGNLARWKRDDDLSREEMRRLDKTAKRANIYDVGMKENFAQVFGRKWYLWLLPIGNGTGDGYTFPVNRKNLVVLQEVTRDVRLGQSV